MKNRQNKQRLQIRRTVAHELPPHTKPADKAAHVQTIGGLAVRTELKAGLLAAGLLGNGAAAGQGGAVPS